MTVAEGLKRFRKEKKLTQADVAKTLGVHQQAYQRYEVGKVLPTITVMIKLAEAYKVSIDYLVGLDVRGDELDDLQNQDKTNGERKTVMSKGGDKNDGAG